MAEVTIIGVDLAKRVFQVHGRGRTDRSLSARRCRAQFLPFLSAQPRCLVAMEACGTAHGWGREIGALGHEVRLIPPVCVKPYVKRHKNDMADAGAIAEAASRPTMRFVAVKTADQQARAMLFRTREMLVRQRARMINALRGHLAEHGVIAGTGIAHVKRLADVIADDTIGLPETVRDLARLHLEQIDQLGAHVAALDKRMRAEAMRSETARRLQTAPGVGPVTAVAIGTFAPAMQSFRCGRDFAVWLGLVPRQHSSGGKQRLGRTSKMGQRDIRRSLIAGAMSVVTWRGRGGGRPGSWLARMLARKPRMLVAIALANKMARMIWAMTTRGESCRDPAGAVC